jgi:hypothetical protein
MKISRMLALVFCIMISFSVMGPTAQAQTFDRLTYFTFSAPVEIPGGKILPAGTYAFKVVDTLGSRNIVQIFNKDQTQLYATVLTIPDYRMNPTDKPIITFAETKQGGPPAIKEWFYPADSYGNEFVYPKNRAVELAKAANQPVPSMPTRMASNINQQTSSANSQNTNTQNTNAQNAQNTSAQAANMQQMSNAPLRAEEPNGHEVEVTEVFIVAPPTAAGNTNAAGRKPAGKLPKTASELPLAGLIGLALTAAGVAFWLIARSMAAYRRHL